VLPLLEEGERGSVEPADANAASAFAIGLPSCSRRADAVSSERPARMTSVVIVAGPILGGAG
jgi:hypothetical protein